PPSDKRGLLMSARNHFSRRPSLEVLEGRAVPAVVPLSTPVITEFDSELTDLQTAIISRSLVPPTVAVAVPSQVDEVVSGPAATLAVGDLTTVFLQPEVVSGPATTLAARDLAALLLPVSGGALPPSLPTLPFTTDVDALGFTGRIVYPGTGLQARV